MKTYTKIFPTHSHLLRFWKDFKDDFGFAYEVGDIAKGEHKLRFSIKKPTNK